MAIVKVHIKIDKTVTIYCDGTNAEECAESICDWSHLDEYTDLIYENFTIIDRESDFDEPPDEENEEDGSVEDEDLPLGEDNKK